MVLDCFYFVFPFRIVAPGEVCCLGLGSRIRCKTSLTLAAPDFSLSCPHACFGAF
jgi:hypothetical protein